MLVVSLDRECKVTILKESEKEGGGERNERRLHAHSNQSDRKRGREDGNGGETKKGGMGPVRCMTAHRLGSSSKGSAKGRRRETRKRACRRENEKDGASDCLPFSRPGNGLFIFYTSKGSK